MNACVKGAFAQLDNSWKAFVHDGRSMTKAEVKAVLEYALSQGFETTAEIPESDIYIILSSINN